MNFDPLATGEKRSHEDVSCDIEDVARQKLPTSPGLALPMVTKHTPTSSQHLIGRKENWKTILGPPPDRGTTKVGVVIIMGVV